MTTLVERMNKITKLYCMEINLSCKDINLSCTDINLSCMDINLSLQAKMLCVN